MRGEETLAIAALIQGDFQATEIHRLRAPPRRMRVSTDYFPRLLIGNKWLAVRYGLDGKLIDFGKETEVDERDLIREYLDFVWNNVVDGLNSRQEINYIHHILEIGKNGADRQIKKFEETNDLARVIDYMAEETKVGLY